ncbi:hypothetical protein GCM10022248_15260 [Nonomuraea soli]
MREVDSVHLAQNGGHERVPGQFAQPSAVDLVHKGRHGKGGLGHSSRFHPASDERGELIHIERKELVPSGGPSFSPVGPVSILRPGLPAQSLATKK